MVGTSECTLEANLQPSLGALIRRVASPGPNNFSQKSLRSPTPPLSPRQRTESLSSSFRSSVATTSSLPEYAHSLSSEYEFGLDSTDTEVKEKRCKCRGSCLSFSVPSDEQKVLDFGPAGSPTFTTSLRPPPRSPSRLSECTPVLPQVLFPDSPPSSLPDHGDSADSSECHTLEDDYDSDAESTYEDAEEDSEQTRHHRPPTLLIRATLPHGAPNLPCNCTDPFCPGGELDLAYDAPLPCNCGLPDCAGGDMSLAWKMRADGIRKSGRVRHVNTHKVAIRSQRKSIVWGYNAAHI